MMALAASGIHLRNYRPGEHRTSCPHCAALKLRRGDHALAVLLKPDGSQPWLCHRCGWKGGSRAAQGYRKPVEPSPPTQPREGAQEAAMALWQTARRIISGTLGAAYLSARGCALPHPDGDLRWLERHRHPSRHVGPALIALVTHAETGEPMTIHRTWVQEDGTKAPVDKPRLLWPGLPKAGGVVRLWPDPEVALGLCVAEGIETALTAARGFGFAWSCLGAGNLGALPTLDGIEVLTIVADHDPAGIDAARSCASRWAAAGVEVRTWVPPTAGVDLNDLAAAPPC
jgi:hypothetical protein